MGRRLHRTQKPTRTCTWFNPCLISSPMTPGLSRFPFPSLLLLQEASHSSAPYARGSKETACGRGSGASATRPRRQGKPSPFDSKPSLLQTPPPFSLIFPSSPSPRPLSTYDAPDQSPLHPSCDGQYASLFLIRRQWPVHKPLLLTTRGRGFKKTKHALSLFSPTPLSQ